MKQILQSFKTGITELAELPSPTVKSGQILIQTTRSLVSLGTEKMLVEFGKASLIQKARQQPDKVKMVLDKIKQIIWRFIYILPYRKLQTNNRPKVFKLKGDYKYIYREERKPI